MMVKFYNNPTTAEETLEAIQGIDRAITLLREIQSKDFPGDTVELWGDDHPGYTLTTEEGKSFGTDGPEWHEEYFSAAVDSCASSQRADERDVNGWYRTITLADIEDNVKDLLAAKETWKTTLNEML